MGAVLPIIVMLITIPLYLTLLGEERYGVLALVWLVLGYFSFMEMGLGKATANQIAKAQTAPARERAEIFWTALTLNAAMGVVAAGILFLVGDYLISHTLKMSAGFRAEALAALPWLVFTFPLALVSSVLNGALEGANKFLLLNFLQVVGNMIFQFMPMLVAYWYSPSLEYVIPAAVVARTITNFALFYACHLLVTDRIVWLVSLSRVRSLLSFGSWVALSSLLTPILETIDRLIIGATIGAKAVTYYTIAYHLAAQLRIIPGALTRALFPRLSIPNGDQFRISVHAMNVLTVLMTPVTVLVTLILNPFLYFWVGADVAVKVNTICYLFLFGMWVNIIGHVPVTLLIGIGKPSTVAKTHLAEVLPFIVLIYVGAITFGVVGVVLAWVIRVIIDTAVMCYFAKMAREAIKVTLLPTLILLCTLSLAYLNDQAVIDPLYKPIGGAILLGLSVWLARLELKEIFSLIYFRFYPRVSS
jgi:O-antigen/teichoic acid export membrane protein